MDLILWRHAQAEDMTLDATLSPQAQQQLDLTRSLTSKGEKQATRMALWLDRQLPEGCRILVSPARRCEQTAQALGRKYRLVPELAPGCTPGQMLAVAQWPTAKTPVLIIGHQPTLGQTIAQLLGMQESDCAVKKGALWWLRYRERESLVETVVVTVQSPEHI
ncbi:Phosphohistidine phosphatase SixA [Polaromonas vacuolata]|uniref:Phosphohistidine phosphatase SixA n=1 Tax=Polaromonas vacuolata TaxID=37448 RepID=A0A6H2HAN2_9BURK|nr:histidine phosphatase family protein [Polaromonas vacuolata]QJC56827.1 Phosphohistidine phosphatase SixA [Polaromonas vacuolata]